MRRMRSANFIRGFIAAVLVLLSAFGVFSATASASSQEDSYYVNDEADLLSDEEEAQLAARLRAIAFSNDCDVAVYTTDADVPDARFDAFCAEYYEDMGYAEDGVLYTIGMENRTWDLYVSGKCRDALDYEAQEVIYEDVLDYLSAGYFYDAFMLYADDIEYYLGADVQGSTAYTVAGTGDETAEALLQQRPKEDRGISFTGIIMSLLGSLGISGASVSAMKRGNKSVYRASGARSYLVQSSLTGTLQQADTFLHNNIIKTPIAVAVNNASSRPGGMGGTSSRPRPTHTYRPSHRPPVSSSGTFRRTGGGGSHGRF
ncbi:MAG: TPM domain-containing protein [Lachnospiraceae bacterium]|nr:TPM domain-containing protein [Lachnospiraceae bacterium]